MSVNSDRSLVRNNLTTQIQDRNLIKFKSIGTLVKLVFNNNEARSRRVRGFVLRNRGARDRREKTSRRKVRDARSFPPRPAQSGDTIVAV